MIKLYGMGSPNVVKVYIALEELGLPYEVAPVDVFSGKQFDAEFLKLNPNAKVPVIVDSDGPGGKPYTCFESGATAGSGIALAVTVGTDPSPNACGVDTTLQATQGDPLNFCYTVTNNSGTTLRYHTLEDSLAGNLLNDIAYTLAYDAKDR